MGDVPVIDYAGSPKFSGITLQKDETGVSIIVPPPSSVWTLTWLAFAISVTSLCVIYSFYLALAANISTSVRIADIAQGCAYGLMSGPFIFIAISMLHRRKGRPTVFNIEAGKLILIVPEWKIIRHEIIINNQLRITAIYIGLMVRLRREGRLIIKGQDFEATLFEGRNWRDIQWIAQKLNATIDEVRAAAASNISAS